MPVRLVSASGPLNASSNEQCQDEIAMVCDADSQVKFVGRSYVNSLGGTIDHFHRVSNLQKQL